MKIQEEYQNFQEEYKNFQKEWRKRILHSFYIVVGVLFATEIVMWIVMPRLGVPLKYNGLAYVMLYILLPSVMNLVFVLITRGIVHGQCGERVKNLAIIFCLLCICLVVASFHGYFLITAGIFVTPIVVSVMFDDTVLTRAAAVAAVIFLTVSVFTANIFDNTWTMSQRLTNGMVGLVFIAVFYVICMALLQFGVTKNAIIHSSSRQNEEMQRALKIDAMTGLYNHTEFYNRLEQYYEDFREKTTHLTVAVLDVDYFKKVNDVYGHECGDTVLIRIADILKQYCGSNGHIFRYGGEEFSVIFRHMSSEEVAGLMNKVREVINGLYFEEMPDEKLGISCGIYEYMGDDTAVQEIFSRADKALYRAKKLGRNRCVCYSEEEQ